MSASFDFATLARTHFNGPVAVGMVITATRLDGRVFSGTVVNTSTTTNRPNDTMVTIVRMDGTHRSFYLDDTTGWSTRNH